MSENAINPGVEVSEEQAIQDILRSWIAGRIPGELPPAWVQDYLNQYVRDYFDKESLIGRLLPFNPYPEDQLLHLDQVEARIMVLQGTNFPKPPDMSEYTYCTSCYAYDDDTWEPSGIFTPTERIEFSCYDWSKGNPLKAVVPRKVLDDLSNEVSCKVFTKIIKSVWASGEDAARPRFRFSHTFDVDTLYEILPEGDEPAWLVASQEVFHAILVKNRPSGPLPKEGVTYTSVPGRPNISILAVAENDALKQPGTKYLEEGMAFYIPKNLGEFQMAHALTPWVKKEVIWINTCLYGVGRVRISRAALAKTAYYSWHPPKSNETGDGETTDEQAAPVEQ